MIAKTVYAFPLPAMPDAMAIFSSLYRFPYTQFLDSTAPQQKNGRYSTIVFQPVEIIELWGDKVTVTNRDQQLSMRENLTDLLAKRLHVWGNGPVTRNPDIPVFQGGAIGYMGFGLNTVKQTVTDIPQAAFGIYDQCVSFDHIDKSAWYVVVTDSQEQADARFAHFERLTARSYLPPADSVQPHLSWAPRTLPGPLIENVRRLTDYIHAGSFDHTYLCQYYESDVPAGYDILAHYADIHRHSNTPFGACQTLGGLNVMVMDAELVFTVIDGQIELPHISHKTARPEGSLRDTMAARELGENTAAMAAHQKMAKEQTINLSSLCYGSGILGPSTPVVEEVSGQYHITSLTRGILSDRVTIRDILDVFTVPGPFNGDPLDRALRVITNMEPCHRGPAFGHMVTISFNGAMTLTVNKDVVVNNGSTVRYASGLPVKADTNPAQWYDQLVASAETALNRISNDTELRNIKTA